MKFADKIHNILWLALIPFLLIYGCSYERIANIALDEYPEIFPDYNHIVIPPNIAPLNFMMENVEDMYAEFRLEDKVYFSVATNDGVVEIPDNEWKELLEDAKGKDINVHLSVWNGQYPDGASFLPVKITVAEEEMDEWIVYRLVEPGYQSWRQLGIYQRDITSFDEKVVVDNKSSTQTCLNCHSFANHSAGNMMFHARGSHGGTYIYKEGHLSKVNIEKMGLKIGASYPAWHPMGKLIAFSSNTTQQVFFESGEQPIEVYDKRSDLIFYDTEKGTVFSDSRFVTSESMETYPAWSPDGKWFYFASAETKTLPEDFQEMHYHLLRIPFDPITEKFGQETDTLYNALDDEGSASYPRISPDGNYLFYTRTSHGTFPIWHKEADLQMMNLKDCSSMDISAWNSEEADSYHAWSSNGRWVVFGSRRLDGRYTRLYLAYWSKEGKAFKPFLLPQKNPKHNLWRMKSYNIPEFITEPARLPFSDFSRMIQ